MKITITDSKAGFALQVDHGDFRGTTRALLLVTSRTIARSLKDDAAPSTAARAFGHLLEKLIVEQAKNLGNEVDDTHAVL